MKKITVEKTPECRKKIRGVSDAQEVLQGKWKVHIISALIYKGTLRFMDLLREVEGIAPKMLSKELKELELNEIVQRTVLNDYPVTIKYELTEHGATLHKVIKELADWGIMHRQKLMQPSETKVA